MARARDGDRDAYGRLVARYAVPAARTAAFLGAGPEADDVVQEAFVRAWRSLGSLRDPDGFRPWLLSIVANGTRNQLRGRRRREEHTRRALELAGPVDPSLSAEAGETRDALLTAVRGLRPEERDVVVCRWFLELSEAETSAVLGIPAGTAKSRASRALTRLRTVLAEEVGR